MGQMTEGSRTASGAAISTITSERLGIDGVDPGGVGGGGGTRPDE